MFQFLYTFFACAGVLCASWALVYLTLRRYAPEAFGTPRMHLLTFTTVADGKESQLIDVCIYARCVSDVEDKLSAYPELLRAYQSPVTPFDTLRCRELRFVPSTFANPIMYHSFSTQEAVDYWLTKGNAAQ